MSENINKETLGDLLVYNKVIEARRLLEEVENEIPLAKSKIELEEKVITREDRILNPLDRSDKKSKTKGEKIWGGIEKVATVAGLFQDVIVGIPKLITEAQEMSSNDVYKKINTTPSIQTTVNNVDTIKGIIENLDISTISKLYDNFGKNLENYNLNVKIRDIINSILSDMLSFIDSLRQNKEEMQKIFYRINEILYTNYEVIVEIIKGKRLPTITKMEEGSPHPSGSPTLAYFFPCNKGVEHQFIILQTTLIDDIKNILMIENPVNDFNWLTTYQFARLFLQLIYLTKNENNEIIRIDNVLTAFYNTEENKFNICNLCPPQ